MRELLKTSEAGWRGYHGYTFPYVGDVGDGSHITYILTEKDTGYSVFFRPEYTLRFKEDIMSAILTVKKKKAVLTAVWSGRCISKIFLVDDIGSLESAVVKEIKGKCDAKVIDFSELQGVFAREGEEEKRRKEKEKLYANFLDTYTPCGGKYASVSEIWEMTAFFISDPTIRNICKKYNVPFRYEDRQCGMGRRTVICFSLDDAIGALRKDYHKYDYLRAREL